MKNILFLFVLLSAGTVLAEERLTFSTTYYPDTRHATTAFVNKLFLTYGRSVAESFIFIELSSGTIDLQFTYRGQEARDQMTLLNKANLTSNSLHKRILNKLISDGKISGSVTGNPD